MAWDDYAMDYPGYRLAFVANGESTNPTPAWSFTMCIKFRSEPQGITGARDQVIRDLIAGMNARGYKLRQGELSGKWELDDTVEVLTVTEDLFVGTIDYFPGWD
ncbi:hypothetical protein ACFZB5_13510 [Streptomyces nodosus]|uniref:hypothetical protein n=1 Tax=Streptomyces nodosus TaxID=40318 RepID=UPI0036ECB9E0